MNRTLLYLAFLLALAFAPPAFAQDAAAPAQAIPLPVAVLSLVSAICAFLSAVIPDDKLPGWLAAIINLAGSNWGAASNDPTANGGR